jgi:hypothetical protein
MAKGYIILRRNFEYNDEINEGGEGGEPVHVFTDKSKAQEKMDELELKAWREERLCDYCYNWSDISRFSSEILRGEIRKILGASAPKKTLSPQELRRQELEKNLGESLNGKALERAVNAVILEEFGEDEEEADDDLDMEWSIPSSATDEQVKQIIKLFDFSFFYIEDAPID